MILIKSFAAGAVALLLYLLLIGAVLWLRTPAGGVGAVAFPMWPVLIVLIGGLLVFAAVCHWTFRRTSKAVWGSGRKKSSPG